MADRVYIGGTFDLFHVGHVRLLEVAASLGDVWVALNTDDFAERYKRRPVVPLDERAEVLEACRWVSGLLVNEGCEDSRPAIEKVRPRFIVHGDDWTGDGYMRQLGVTEDWLAERNITIRYLPYTKGVSTSSLLERMAA